MKKTINFIITFWISVLFAACSNNNPPVESLSLQNAPTDFLGKATWQVVITNLAVTTVVTGQCDARAEKIELSMDAGLTWEDASTLSGSDTDCSNQGFSIPLAPQRLTSLGFEGTKSLQKILLVRQVLQGAGSSDTAYVTLKYSAPTGPRPDGTRIVLTSLKSEESAPYQIKVRAYTRPILK